MTDDWDPSEKISEAIVDESEQLVLSDLVNRVLDKGVVITSHIRISIADVDLIELDLRLMLSSVALLAKRGTGGPPRIGGAKGGGGGTEKRGDVPVRPRPRR